MTIDLASRLKTLLQSRNLKVKDLSQISGIDTFTINNLLQGRSKRLKHVMKIADVLNIKLDQLTSEEKFLDIELYQKAVEICCEVLKSEHIKRCSATFLKDLFLRIYNLLGENSNPTQLTMYIKGIIDASYKYHIDK